MHAPLRHLRPTQSAPPTISVGVIGCGYWGPNLARNFRQLPNCLLRSLCDTDSERLYAIGRQYSDLALHMDFRPMLADAELDAVVVATPVRHHFPIARAALEAGKHVLIEKPMAGSSRECEELIEIAARRGLVLMVGHTFLYSEPVRAIARIIESGVIGDVRYINSQRLNLGLFQQDINVAWDLAPHDISIILSLLGRMPETVNCQGNAHVTEGIEDVTNISLGFQGNCFATVQSSWLEPRKVRQMTIVGSKQMIVYDDLQPHDKIRIHDVRVERDSGDFAAEIDRHAGPRRYDTFGEFQYSYHYGESSIPRLRLKEPLQTECEHFLECIATGRRPLSDGEQGLALVRVLEATSQSLRADGASIRVGGEWPSRPVSAAG